MLTSNFTAEIDSRQTHNTYIADSDAYRMLYPALKDQRRMAAEGGYRFIERFGARLIAIGRTLCERRGTLAVEIAFHAERGDPAHKPGGRHVA